MAKQVMLKFTDVPRLMPEMDQLRSVEVGSDRYWPLKVRSFAERLAVTRKLYVRRIQSRAP